MIKINAEKYIGMTNTMNCGMKATIIAYRQSKDIDVQFENGIISEHRSMSNFNTGRISPTTRLKAEAHVGQTKLMECGMKATVIAYRKTDDIDIRFENGTIRKHMHMSSFNKGIIGIEPKLKDKSHLGQTKLMKCGMKATVIAYRKFADADVQFEDGTIRQHAHLGKFNKGLIPHPTSILFDKYEISKVAFAFHNKTYFYVTYTENGDKITDVMCIDDMKQKLPELAR